MLPWLPQYIEETDRLMGRDFWQPLLDFIRTRMVAEGTIDPQDLSRITVSDSVDEVVKLITDTGMRRFALTYGRKLRPQWFLGE